MQLNDIISTKRTSTTQRVGRGGTRGKTSGRGTKGQKSRAGHKIRPEIRDRIKKIPKRRGYGKNRSRTIRTNRTTSTPVSLSMIEEYFNIGETISPYTLLKRKVIRSSRGGVKILATGTLTKKITVIGCAASAKAKESIEAAGGTISNV